MVIDIIHNNIHCKQLANVSLIHLRHKRFIRSGINEVHGGYITFISKYFRL